MENGEDYAGVLQLSSGSLHIVKHCVYFPHYLLVRDSLSSGDLFIAYADGLADFLRLKPLVKILKVGKD